MARNEEKLFGRLNRYLLKQENDEKLKKNPPRPKLATLNNLEEIKKWIPSIKRDIDFCLKQSQVPCYTERKVTEYRDRIEFLKREYQAFVRKLRHIDPSIGLVPWTERSYETKKRVAPTENDHSTKLSKCDGDIHCTNVVTQSPEKTVSAVAFVPLCTPLLDMDSRYKDYYGYHRESMPIVWNSNVEEENKALHFNSITTHSTGVCQRTVTYADNYECEFHQSDPTTILRSKTLNNRDEQPPTSNWAEAKAVSLNLPYSDSSDDDT